MKLDIMKKILEKIKEYDKIIIMRHFRPDGDAIGSTKGLYTILKATYPEKKIYLLNNDMSDYLAFLGGEDEPISDEEYADALGIVVDTATLDRISNKKYSLCRELVKIDHHIDIKPYGDYAWIEDECSSASELIAKFYYTFRDELKITTEAATYIYTGMVTDTGRFRFRSVSGDTMRYAGMLLDLGIDTDTLYANLYLKDFNLFKFEAYVYENMQITENGVAYLYVDKAMQERFNLSGEDASAAVSYLDSIKGSLVWLAFIDNPEGSIRVRLRSRFMTINKLAEQYRGGGHDCAAGATVYNGEEMAELISKADALVAEYKSTHEGWL